MATSGPDTTNTYEPLDESHLTTIAACDPLVEQLLEGELSKASAISAIGASIPDAVTPGAHGNASFLHYLSHLEEASESMRRAAGYNRPDSSTPEISRGYARRDAPRYTNLFRPHSPSDDAPDPKRVKFSCPVVPWLLNKRNYNGSAPSLGRPVYNPPSRLRIPQACFRSSVSSTTSPSRTLNGWRSLRERLSISTKYTRTGLTSYDIDDELESTRRVANVSDWEEAWRRFYAALTFVSPHWKAELDGYRTWIQDRLDA